jgi:hypothetical protein
VWPCPICNGYAFHRLPDHFSRGHGSFVPGIGQDYRKLFPAVASDRIADPPGRIPNGPDNADQASISDLVAVDVVSSLEMVDIDHDK